MAISDGHEGPNEHLSRIAISSLRPFSSATLGRCVLVESCFSISLAHGLLKIFPCFGRIKVCAARPFQVSKFLRLCYKTRLPNDIRLCCAGDENPCLFGGR